MSEEIDTLVRHIRHLLTQGWSKDKIFESLKTLDFSQSSEQNIEKFWAIIEVALTAEEKDH